MKNTGEVRSFLIERMVALADGKESIAQSHAVTALAKQVNATLALELSAARLLDAKVDLKCLRIGG